METAKIRKPRVKKVIEETKTKEVTANPESAEKQKVILGIDPAWKKCGFGIIALDTGKYIESFQLALKPDRKMT